MKRLLDALVLYMQDTSNGMTSFMGAASGIAGPYLNVVPDAWQFPYTVLTQIGGTPNWQGFSLTYVARAHIRISLWDIDQATVMTNTEFVASKIDVLGSLTLGGVELCRLPIRIEEPRFLSQGVATSDAPTMQLGTGDRIYGGILEYRFNVQRTRGQL